MKETEIKQLIKEAIDSEVKRIRKLFYSIIGLLVASLVAMVFSNIYDKGATENQVKNNSTDIVNLGDGMVDLEDDIKGYLKSLDNYIMSNNETNRQLGLEVVEVKIRTDEMEKRIDNLHRQSYSRISPGQD